MDSVHSENKNQQIKWQGQAGGKHLGNGSEVIDCARAGNQSLIIHSFGGGVPL